MSKKIYIVGIGMDGNATLTVQGQQTIAQAEVLIGAKRMLQPFCDSDSELFDCYDSEQIAAYIEASPKHCFAVLLSGDCGFYSGAQKLLPLLGAYETQVISGLSSPVYFAGRLQMPWQDWFFVSLHGAAANVVRNVASHVHTFFLLGTQPDAKTICKRLTEYGLGDVTVYIGENLASMSEQLTIGRASELQTIETGRLAVMLVENPGYERTAAFGIADDAFVRGKVPMTKAEVRSIVLSKLAVHTHDVCWDIGSGTGSVSVELALQCTQGTVHAVERKTEACALTKENSRRFKCDNIILHEGDAQELVKTLPVPDCVFIGGSGGTLEKLVQTAYEKNSAVRVVITAVSLETLNEAVSVFRKNGREADIVQVAVTRTRKIGSHTMFEAQNPIYIITST